MDPHLLTNKRGEFEQQIIQYEGDDPLDLRYKFLLWVEETANKGIDMGFTQLLNETLNLYVNSAQYTQDSRYVNLLIKHIETQPNALDIYQLVYNQGRGIECAVLYCAWAAHFEKTKDLRKANEIYQLGLGRKAQPLEQLQQQYMLFQLNIGRNMLGMGEIATPNTPVREAFRILQPNSVQPLHLQQNPLPLGSKQHQWVAEPNGIHTGTGDPNPRQRMRLQKPDTFVCQVAIFEPDDPTKKRCYPKHEIYAVEGKELQLEEIYASRYEERRARIKQQHAAAAAALAAQPLPVPMSPQVQNHQLAVVNPPVEDQKRDVIDSGPEPVAMTSNHVDVNSAMNCGRGTNKLMHAPELHAAASASTSRMNVPERVSSNSSVINSNQSMTVNTKEVMNFIQDFWKSPSPVAVPKRAVCGAADSNMGRSAQPSKMPFKLYMDEADKTPGREVAAAGRHVENRFGNRNAQASHASGIPSWGAANEIAAHNAVEPLPPPRFPVPIYNDENSDAKMVTSTAKKLPVPGPLPNAAHGPQLSSRKSLFIRPKPDDGFDRLAEPSTNTKENLSRLNEHQKNAIPIHVDMDENTNGKVYKQAETFVDQMQSELGMPMQDVDFANITCNTRAFNFALPSSTPFANNPSRPTHGSDRNTGSSFVVMDEGRKTNADLSMILEASKERFSSSPGSNSSGRTPCGSQALKQFHPTMTEEIKEESLTADVERNVCNLILEENIDPFCPKLISRLLGHINFPQKNHASGLSKILFNAPELKQNSTIVLGKEEFRTEKEIGKGAYAKVVKAVGCGRTVGLKLQKPACMWEYYIAREIQARLKDSPLVNGFIKIDKAFLYNNASILETEWAAFGSLIKVVNDIKLATGKPLHVSIATLLSIQLFSIVEHLHKCKIIHGDIKPDNFVLHSLPTTNSSEFSIKLIDFGRSIDMTLMPEGVEFKNVVTTDGFQCNEMKEGRPWTYQTDLYGLAGTCYCLLMGEYMKVIKKRGEWALQQVFHRYLHKDVWQPVCHELLNAPSCTKLPNLTELRGKLETLLASMDQRKLQLDLTSLANTLHGH